MKRVKFFVFSILVFSANGLFAQVPSEASENAKPVAVKNTGTSTKEVSQSGEFEIVVSSYRNNGVKTIIVTRNKNNNFFDRIEWVGKGEIPVELKRIMGKEAAPAPVAEKETPAPVNMEKSFFGVVIKDSEFDGGSVEIDEVVNKSPATVSGLKKGDVITGLGGKKVKETEDLAKILTEHSPGDKVICRFFRENRLVIEKVTLGEPPVGSGLNFGAIDGGHVQAMPQMQAAASGSILNMPEATGGKDVYTDSKNLTLSNFSAFVTPNNDWLNISFNGDPLPLSVIVLDSKGKEIFHQHLSWFQGNYKQLIKLNPGVVEPFQVVVAQGASVFSQLVEDKE